MVIDCKMRLDVVTLAEREFQYIGFTRDCLVNQNSYHQLMTDLFVYITYVICFCQPQHRLTLLKENKLMHGHLLASLILRGGANLIIWAQIAPLSELIPSCKCFPNVSKMWSLTYNCVCNVYVIFVAQKVSNV